MEGRKVAYKFAAKTIEPCWLTAWTHTGSAFSRFFQEPDERLVLELQLSWRTYPNTLLSYAPLMIYSQIGGGIQSVLHAQQFELVMRDIGLAIQKECWFRQAIDHYMPPLLLLSMLVGPAITVQMSDNFDLDWILENIYSVCLLWIGPPVLVGILWAILLFLNQEQMLMKRCATKIQTQVLEHLNMLLVPQGFASYINFARVPCWRACTPGCTLPSESVCYALFIAVHRIMQPIATQIQTSENYYDASEAFPINQTPDRQDQVLETIDARTVKREQSRLRKSTFERFWLTRTRKKNQVNPNEEGELPPEGKIHPNQELEPASGEGKFSTLDILMGNHHNARRERIDNII